MQAFGGPGRVLLALAGMLACVGASAQPAPPAAASSAAAAAPATGSAAAASASAGADAAQRTGQTQGSAPAAGPIQRKRRRHLPRVPRRRDPGLLGRGDLQGQAFASQGQARAVRPRRLAVRGLPRSRRPPCAQQEPGLDQQPQGELVANGAGTQPALPQLPPGGCEDLLARQHARAQRPRMRRLPPDPPGQATRCSRRPASPRCASAVTGRSGPTSRSRPPIRCASA